jgi:methionine-rich copper-binding protein CopC
MRRAGLVLAAAALLAFAQAHAYLESSTPAGGAVLETAPETLVLEFSEELEVGFSTFKLFRLEDAPDVADEDHAAKLNGMAALLVTEVIGTSGPDDRAVAFELAPGQGRSAKVTLTPAEPLAPGSYVLMWRVLSVDTHTLQDYVTFTVLEPALR